MIPIIVKAWFLVALLMVGFWLIEWRRNNASYIDVGWVIGIALTVVMLAVSSTGDSLRILILVLMIACWSLRLSYHLLRRITKDPHEDKRYAKLRQLWAQKAHVNFFGLFQFQALLAVLLGIGMLPAFIDANPVWHMTQTLGVIIWLIGFLGESLADRQLQEFKANPAHKGLTCDVGLWHYSRHPNYFFEWVMWIGYAIYQLQSPFGIWAWGAVIIMLLFLVKLTGIPFSEEMALQTRGEVYRRYQETTSMFIPWFKRKVKV